MFAQIRRSQIIIGLLASLAIVTLASYFSERRTAGTSLNQSSPKHLSEALVLANGSAAPRERHGSSRSAGGTPAVPAGDSDEDGLPDTAELSSFMDRENFHRWFTYIAELQFYRLSQHWNVDQRDCSGLVRFAWREALRRHDRTWFKKMGPGYEPIGPDVAVYRLEQSPLREKLFRTDFGSYKESDLAAGRFSEFADARTLKMFNSRFVSRNRKEAQAGDLLFFHQPWVQEFPFHVMVYLGRGKIADDGNHDWVVYHTGSSVTDQGAVKKVRLSILDQHPNKRWRPVEINRNFLGFYRLKILE